MNFPLFAKHSIKTRVTLVMLSIFVVSIWLLSSYISRMLRSDMERLLGDQQFSTASLVADDIERDLMDRILWLQSVAATITPTMLANPACSDILPSARSWSTSSAMPSSSPTRAESQYMPLLSRKTASASW
jgi:hypothetical protein